MLGIAIAKAIGATLLLTFLIIIVSFTIDMLGGIRGALYAFGIFLVLVSILTVFFYYL